MAKNVLFFLHYTLDFNHQNSQPVENLEPFQIGLEYAWWLTEGTTAK